MNTSSNIAWEQFEAVDMRIGTIVAVEKFPEARRPAYKLKIDFGKEIGVKKTSAQITDLYQPSQLIGIQVMAVVNFPPKQIGNFMSECLVMGVYSDKGVVLLKPEQAAPNGARVG